MTTKDWIQYSSALAMICSGIVLAFMSFFKNDGDISEGVLWYVAKPSRMPVRKSRHAGRRPSTRQRPTTLSTPYDARHDDSPKDHRLSVPFLAGGGSAAALIKTPKNPPRKNLKPQIK